MHVACRVPRIGHFRTRVDEEESPPNFVEHYVVLELFSS